MKKFTIPFILMLFLFSNCQNSKHKYHQLDNNTTNSIKIKQDSIRKAQDSIMKIEEKIAISDINFNISEKEFLDKKAVLCKTLNYRIGNFDFYGISGYFHNDSLYEVSFNNEIGFLEYATAVNIAKELKQIFIKKYKTTPPYRIIADEQDIKRRYIYNIAEFNIGSKKTTISITKNYSGRYLVHLKISNSILKEKKLRINRIQHEKAEQQRINDAANKI